MYLFLLRNYKNKLFLLISFSILCIFVIIGTRFLLSKTIKYTITINDQFSFAYPSAVNISEVYSNDDNSENYLQVSNSNYKKFIEFKYTKDGFEFSYPSIFKINEQKFSGTEILYHIAFENKEDKAKGGYFQVWNLPYSLESFLEASKQTSLMNFINFSSKKIKVNNLDGYLWEYVITSPSGNRKALEAFLSNNSKLYRISYFLPEKEYNNNEYELFWNMVKSIKIS